MPLVPFTVRDDAEKSQIQVPVGKRALSPKPVSPQCCLPLSGCCFQLTALSGQSLEMPAASKVAELIHVFICTLKILYPFLHWCVSAQSER